MELRNNNKNKAFTVSLLRCSNHWFAPFTHSSIPLIDIAHRLMYRLQLCISTLKSRTRSLQCSGVNSELAKPLTSAQAVNPIDGRAERQGWAFMIHGKTDNIEPKCIMHTQVTAVSSHSVGLAPTKPSMLRAERDRQSHAARDIP